MKFNKMLLTLSLCLLGSIVLLTACGGSNSGESSLINNFTGTSRVSGTASGPANGQSGSASTALANAAFTTVDISSSQPITLSAQLTRQGISGTTDANGGFSAPYVVANGKPATSAIVVRGQVDGGAIRISGLVRPNSSEVSKDLNAATDVAAEAAATAVNDGSLDPTNIDSTTISNLEAGAAQVISSSDVNFLNPASVASAAAMVNELTNNGANAPGESNNDSDTPVADPPSDEPKNTSTGGFDCSNGSYTPNSSGCGVETFKISDDGTSLTVMNFGNNETKTFTITSRTEANAGGLVIFDVAEHDCKFVCNTADGTIGVSCSNQAGGTCSQTNSIACTTGTSTCADGQEICAEQVCNGVADCADGSDEDPSTCGQEASCCTATSGCPGENGTSCADSCCCCSLGQVCDQGNFENGCVDAS